MKICPQCAATHPDEATHCQEDGAPLRAPLDAVIGRTIGERHRVISRLGQGGMSNVYLAQNAESGELVALKTLRRELARDPIQRDRFMREARAVNRIRHENVVRITDFGVTDDGLLYLVAEYVPGDSLLRLLASGPLSSTRALSIAEQVTRGLLAAHEMGIVHRDLKPENVLLVAGRDGRDLVKLVDFGIAKILDAPALTGSQQIFGTPGYIAPEYIQSTAIDGRADLYSLGVILYEMVTGSLPFDYEYPGDLLVKHVTDPPIPPRERRPAVEAVVEALILRCLRKDPDERFADARALLAAIEATTRALGDSWSALAEPSAGVESASSAARRTTPDP